MLTLHLLEISKQLTSSTKYFTLNFKTNDICFSFSSQGEDITPKYPDHVKKKSRSQKRRDFKTIRKLFLEKKNGKIHMPFELDMIAPQIFLL